MCTVVTRWSPGEPVEILAVRDELTSRDFDEPGEWWPEHAGVIGGRDRLAGGTWCASDLVTGTTALVLNRTERQTGTPSRGLLPLLAVTAGARWTDRIDQREMASFTLVLAGPDGVSTWEWDAVELRRTDLPPGTHVMTSAGVDTGEKCALLAPRFASRPWREVLTADAPVDDKTALIVRHEFETDTFATVFGQLITQRPGRLRISWSRRPWLGQGWSDREFAVTPTD